MNDISASQIATLLNITKQAGTKRSGKENWPYEPGKNRTKRFIFASLPEDIRIRLAEQQAQKAAPPTDNKNLQVAPYIKDSSPIPVGDPGLPDWKNRLALAKADLVHAYIREKERAKKAGESVVDAANTFVNGYNTGLLYPSLHKTLGNKAFKTLESWTKTYKDSNFDFVALGTGYGNRLGSRKITDDEFNTALSFALHPNRLRIAEVSRLTKSLLKRRQIESPSCESTIRRAINEWRGDHYDQWVFCREGRKALNDKCLFYLERDINTLDVGDVLVADGHTLNFEVMNPFTGKPKRMTMLMWYDWACCGPVGWDIMPTENVQCVSASFRRAIRTIGKIPKVAYLDNGRAFKAKIFTSKEVDFEEAGFQGMFARLGVETLFAWPYNAQSKVVERFFGTFNELERLMPTYTGSNILDKPARMHRNEKLHQQMHEKRYGGWVPTIAEASNIIAGWVNEYMARPHRALRGIAPADILQSGIGPGIDENALRFLMMSMEVKKIGRNGIPFMGRNYYNDALYGKDKRVLIRYDLEDLSSVYVYDQSGSTLICEAEPVEKVHPVARLLGTPDDMAAVKEGIRRKRAQEKHTQKSARDYVENAPALVLVPPRETAPSLPAPALPEKKREKHVPLPKAEAERIEAEAAKMKVAVLTPKTPEPRVFVSEADRYEALLEQECKTPDAVSLDDMAFMRYYETTKEFKMFKERFDFLKELFLVPLDEAQQGGKE